MAYLRPGSGLHTRHHTAVTADTPDRGLARVGAHATRHSWMRCAEFSLGLVHIRRPSRLEPPPVGPNFEGVESNPIELQQLAVSEAELGGPAHVSTSRLSLPSSATCQKVHASSPKGAQMSHLEPGPAIQERLSSRC